MTYPNFVIIGPPKTGTTALFTILGQHSQIQFSRIKEPGFFLAEDERNPFGNPKSGQYTIDDLAVYLSLFNLADQVLAYGEASTLYFFSSQAAKTMHAFNPDMRIISVLRNPIDRAYSEYLMYSLNQRETRSFAEAIAAEIQGPKQVQSWQPTGNYLRRGLYTTYLKAYIQLFPREQMNILLHDALLQYPEQTIDSLVGFLGLPIEPLNTDQTINKSGMPRLPFMDRLFFKPNALKDSVKHFVPHSLRRTIRHTVRNKGLSKPPMDPEIRIQLLDYYREEINSLEDMLLLDLTAWKSVE
jgi:hypothetical protein